MSEPITAAMLYDLVQCPHRPAMDLFEDPAKRDEINAFVQLLWEKGTAYEHEVIDGLTLPMLDLSRYAGDEKERQTFEAMQPKEHTSVLRNPIDFRLDSDRLACATAGWGKGALQEGQPPSLSAVIVLIRGEARERGGKTITMSGFRMGLLVSLTSIVTPAVAVAADDEAKCTTLRNLVLDAGYVTSANMIAASGDVPAYCRVRAIALPAISIEVRLPAEGWNGKLYQVGCGGFCSVLGRSDKGKRFVNAMTPGLRRGYATATSDSGHHGLSVIDASWADHNPPAERDWGWRSIGETNRVAKVLIAAYYGTDSESAFFQGCSTGGRMAHMAAIKYPAMFSGIISGAPAMDYAGLVVTQMAWITQANTGPDGKAILKPGKDALIGDEVMRQCDSADGKVDGVIDDPRACRADLSKLQCEQGVVGNNCLAAAELGVIAKWRQGGRLQF